jgi:DNA polymerase-4
MLNVKERIVLHSDLNNFYASVERKLHPELIGKPIAVCGNKEERKGIVLAKSEEAKRFGVKTGDTVWQAQKKCKNLIIVKPHFSDYMEYSRKVKAIYAQYTDLIESYGIDECWLDVTASTLIFPKYDGQKVIEVNGENHFTDEYLRFIGDTIRNTVKTQLGLTVSVGVSFNKIFAKLGSDLKKPDGTSVISKLHYKDVIYALPVADLLMVGGATDIKLKSLGFTTIGSLAAADDNLIYKSLGKFGHTLLTYARGEDDDPVKHMDEDRELKSIGNSQTYAQDLNSYDQVQKMIYVLSESVAARLRESGVGLADTVHLWVRDGALNNFTFQKKVRHTCLCGEIAEQAFLLFCKNFSNPFAVRSLGVTVSGFDGESSQITMDESCGDYKKREKVERCVDDIRKKHGYAAVQRGILLHDPDAMHDDVKNSHLIKPARFEDKKDENK